MHPSMGTQHIQMGKGGPSKQQRLVDAKNALSLASQQGYMMGQQTVMDAGSGAAVKASRNATGIPTMTAADGMFGVGPTNNFAQPGNIQPGNIVEFNPMDESGSLATGRSMTTNPNDNPEEFQAAGLAERAALIAAGGQYMGANNRSMTLGLG